MRARSAPVSGTLRIGIVGAGFVARRSHLPAWRAVSGAEVTALCDIDPATLAAASRESGVADLHADFRELIATDVDAVAVCTPHALHFEVARAALLAGKHVVCEKPLGVSAAEAAALGALADARGLVLTAQHQLRFAGPAIAARACVESGRIGDIYHMRVRALRRNRIPTGAGFLDRDLAGGGAVLDLGVHALDLALWLAGFPRPVRVTGSVRTNFSGGSRIPGFWGEWDRDRVSVEDFGSGFVRFENGATLQLECAWAGHFAEEGLSCELFGERGNLGWPSAEVTVQGATFERETLATEVVGDAHAAALQAFCRAVRGEGPTPVPWTEASASLAILEAVYASARAGAEIRIGE